MLPRRRAQRTAPHAITHEESLSRTLGEASTSEAPTPSSARLPVAGHASDRGFDPGARLVDRLHVQPGPRDPTVTDAAHEHADHVEPRPGRLRPVPMPLAPHGVA